MTMLYELFRWVALTICKPIEYDHACAIEKLRSRVPQALTRYSPKIIRQVPPLTADHQVL